MKRITKQISSIMVGFILAAMIIMVLPVVVSGNFFGGWTGEEIVSTGSEDETNLLISTGTDASLVIQPSTYYYAPSVLDFQFGTTDPYGADNDMAGLTGQPGWTDETSLLSTHPFYPIISMIANQTDIPVRTVWIIAATFILMAATIACFSYAPHQLLTAFVGTALCILFWNQGIYPFWVVFSYVVAAVAILIYERQPSL